MPTNNNRQSNTGRGKPTVPKAGPTRTRRRYDEGGQVKK